MIHSGYIAEDIVEVERRQIRKKVFVSGNTTRGMGESQRTSGLSP